MWSCLVEVPAGQLACSTVTQHALGPDPFVPEDLPAHAVAMAEAVNRLGGALVGRTIEPDRAAAMTIELDSLTKELMRLPQRRKTDDLGQRNRVRVYIETGEWPGPPPEGAQVEFDPGSFVGGELNPFAMGARYYRDGDEAVGHVTLGRAFEGPPERVHGGAVCAIFDEVLGSVFRVTGTPSAFTGELSVRFEKPAPLGVPLEFRGRQVRAEGRRRYLEGEGHGPDGVFARCTAIFIEMRADQFVLPSE